VEEKMIAIGLNRACIRLGKWVHFKFHSSLAAAGLGEASQQTQPAIILLTRANSLAVFYRGDNELGMSPT
jgi:hypothetical protein